MTTDAIAHAKGYLAVINRVQTLTLDSRAPRPPLWQPITMLRQWAAKRAIPARLTAHTEIQKGHARALRSLGAGSTPASGDRSPSSTMDESRSKMRWSHSAENPAPNDSASSSH